MHPRSRRHRFSMTAFAWVAATSGGSVLFFGCVRYGLSSWNQRRVDWYGWTHALSIKNRQIHRVSERVHRSQINFAIQGLKCNHGKWPDKVESARFPTQKPHTITFFLKIRKNNIPFRCTSPFRNKRPHRLASHELDTRMLGNRHGRDQKPVVQ